MEIREDFDAYRKSGDAEGIDELRNEAAFEARLIEEAQGGAAADHFYDLAMDKADLFLPLRDRWLVEAKDDITQQTAQQHRGATEEFATWLGEQPTIQQVTRRKAGEYISDHLMGSGRAPKTISRHVSSLSTFWRWLVRRGICEANHWRDQALPKPKKKAKRPFTDEEVHSLLQNTGLLSPAGLPLIPVMRLAMFTGARLGELCDLKVRDCIVGVLNITDGKTEAAVRAIPIHPAIASLVERLTANRSADEYLIEDLRPGGPDAKRGWNLTRRFTSYRRKLGLPDGALDFHSFRRTAITKLENAGVQQNVVAQLVGHKKEGLTFGLYSGGLDIEVLRDALKQISYREDVMALI